MALVITYSYKSKNFSYSVRESQYKGHTKYFVNVYIACKEVHFHVAEKNSSWGCNSERLAKKKIMRVLKEKCVGTGAEEQMKNLPIFQEEGYQETLFPDE